MVDYEKTPFFRLFGPKPKPEESTQSAAEQFQRKHHFEPKADRDVHVPNTSEYTHQNRTPNPRGPYGVERDGSYGPRMKFAMELAEAQFDADPVERLKRLAKREFERRLDLESHLKVEKSTNEDGLSVDDMLKQAKALVEERLELKAVLRALQDNLTHPSVIRAQGLSRGEAHERYMDHPIWLAAETRLTEINRKLNKLGGV